MTDRYAMVRDNRIIALSEHETDHEAQGWYQSSAREQYGRAVLVVLDLGAGETPSVGDRVRVDDDGVAVLADA
jgi:hypothetical protein